MKKFYTFMFFLCLSVYVSGQTYLSENFSSGMMPPAGWTIQNLSSQWSISFSNNAGGNPPEGKFTYIDSTATSQLISPSVDLTGVDSVTLMFDYYYDWFTSPAPQVGVATRHGSGAWDTIWQILPDTTVGPLTVILKIKNSDVNHSNFQFCFFITGNLYNINYWYLDDIYLYQPCPLDLGLISISLPAYDTIGDSDTLKGKVKNLGLSNITSFDVSYSIDGGTPTVWPITGLNIPMGNYYDFIDNIPLAFSSSGTYHVVADIQNVNGGNDCNHGNDTLAAYIGIVPYKPGKKVFAEEATGTWCGWCVRGICYMNYMKETYPDTWLGVAVHDYDPMVDSIYDADIPNIIPGFYGYPSGTIDRVGNWDPQDFETAYKQRINAVSPGSVEIDNFNYDPSTRVVNLDVTSNILIDVYNELRFGLVISQDSVWGRTSGYIQANYYSGGGNGVMCGFESLPSEIPAADMHYDHVARAILDSPYGTPGSLPIPATAGNYSHHYTYTLDSTLVFEKLNFIALLMDYSNSQILNANNVLNYPLGVKNKNREIQLAVYPNPFNSSCTVKFTFPQASQAELKVLDLLGNTVYQENAKTYPAGENKVLLNGEYFNSGLFILELNVGNKIYTEKISVIK